MNFVAVPISNEIYNELVIRKGDPEVDVGNWIENIIQNYLDRTADDSDWSEAYYEWRAGSVDLEAFASEYGDPNLGYHWSGLFLPNGTKISMEYKNQQYHAEVKREQIHHAGQTYSPSELASAIAKNTSRNAWRDLRIKRPKDPEWILADTLRRTPNK